ncbi:MAG: hypothetical protein Q8P35_01855 [Candidatus Yanofskybacteria bacterium]|nr:hypothetical protein [Candidatus Yanofskybacteria bacterium]
MKITKAFRLKWWQWGLAKICFISLGALVAMSWPEFFVGRDTILLVLFAVPAAYIGFIWWRQ